MANELTKVSYETALGSVDLDANTVKQYLVRGNGDVSDQEVVLFVKMCQAQKLNPFVTGEVYLIKFGNSPAQMVVGYDAYKRRAEENPQHLYTESGITVVRGTTGEIVQKPGACLYPTEQLIGGWCKVHKLKGQNEVVTFKEVTFDEYNKGNAIWKEKPCTMIEKVAISQCLREAYPKDFEGLYTPEELAPQQYNVVVDTNGKVVAEIDDEPEDPEITQSERKKLFNCAHIAFGKDDGNEIIKKLCAEEGLETTAGMKMSTYNRIFEKLDVMVRESQEADVPSDFEEV